jgi:tetratricopeptide (TPR) repeat protein
MAKHKIVAVTLAVAIFVFLWIGSMAWYRLRLAEFYERTGNRSAAIRVYEKIFRKSEIKSINPFKSILTAKIPAQIRYRISKQLASFYLESGYKNKAINCYTILKEISPGNIDSYLILYALTQNEEKLFDILLDYQDFKFKNSLPTEFLQTPLWRYYHGVGLAKRKRYKEARNEFARLTSEYPYLSTFHYYLGSVLGELGLTEEANKEYRIACNLNHDYLSKARSDDFKSPFDLVGIWKLDEKSGCIAKDGSGNYSYGYINGAKWVNGISGSALYFDGIKDTVIINDNSSLHLDDKDFTITMWVKPVSQKKYRFVYYKSRVNLDLYSDDTTWNFRLQTLQTGRRELKIGLPIEEDNWYFIVQRVEQGKRHEIWIFDRKGLIKKEEKIEAVTYVGSDGYALQLSHPGESGNFTITSNDARFKGAIDEIMIFNRALTDVEIQKLFRSF